MANISKKLLRILPKALVLIGAIVCGVVFLSPAKASAAPSIQFGIGVNNFSNDPTFSSHYLQQSEAQFTVTGNGTTLSSSTDNTCFSVTSAGTSSWIFTFDQTKPACLAKLLPGKSYVFHYADVTPFVSSHEYTSNATGWFYKDGVRQGSANNDVAFSYQLTNNDILVYAMYSYKYLGLIFYSLDNSSPPTPPNSLSSQDYLKQNEFSFSSGPSAAIGTGNFAGSPLPGQFLYYFYYRQGQTANIRIGDSPQYPYRFASRDIYGMTNGQDFTINDPSNAQYIYSQYTYEDGWTWGKPWSPGLTYTIPPDNCTDDICNVTIYFPYYDSLLFSPFRWQARGVSSPSSPATTDCQGCTTPIPPSLVVAEAEYQFRTPSSTAGPTYYNLHVTRLNGRTSTLRIQFQYSPPPPPATKYSCSASTHQCAADPNGSYSDSATCAASCTAPPPPTVTLNAVPDTVDPGPDSFSRLTWSSTNATSCKMGVDWIANNIGTSGHHDVTNIQSPLYFTLTCTGPGGPKSTSATIKLTGGNFILNGNNQIRAAVFVEGNARATAGANNMDLIGSYLAKNFNFAAASNTSFRYDFNLGNHWPPGFRFFNMPVASER